MFSRLSERIRSATEGVPSEFKSDLYATAGPIGMAPLQQPPSPTIDIVFVHGLTGNRMTTWTHNNKTLWPRDLLTNDFPNARILTFGYDADVVKMWKVAGSNGLLDHGKSLAHAIAASRPTPLEQERPLILIAHSLGGLVCEQAILVSKRAGPEYPRLLAVSKGVRGIIFMGTPHQGSNLAHWGSTLAKYLNLVRSVNRKIVATLEVESEVLKGVEEEFQQMLLTPDHIGSTKIFCFYEEIAVTGVGFIVLKDSAMLPQYKSTSIHANHMDMTKFSGPEDAGYRAVAGILREWVDGMEAPSPVSMQKDRATLTPPADVAINSGVNSGGGPQFLNSSVSGNTISWTVGK